MTKSKKPKPRETMFFSELKKLQFCNSKKLPSHIEVLGKRMWWVGFTWVDLEEKPKHSDVLILDDPEPKKPTKKKIKKS